MNYRQLFVQLACIWEATARKPGNVHRFADFADVKYLDFLTSAAAVAPVLASADQRPLGDTILQAVQAMRLVALTNTNLGIILLLAPLCAGTEILAETTVDDSRKVYAAIRLANPGGMGKAADQDLADEPTLPLCEIMQLAADRDMIARQYVNHFRDIHEVGYAALSDGLAHYAALEPAIVHCHLRLLTVFPDSLIARKYGASVAGEVQRRACELFNPGWEADPQRPEKIAAFDRWLREQGRNPGTTADLVTACLFIALQEGKIQVPLRMPWSAGR